MLRLSRSINVMSSTAISYRCMSLQFRATNSEQDSPLRERLSVTLFGKISQKPMALGKGAIIFPMITRNTDGEFYTIHNIFAPISSLKNAPVDRLTEGARVYVSGVIRYLDFHNAEGRLKQQGQILSSSVLLCEQSENPSNDINHVTLFGYVKSKPRVTENVTFVDVNTKFYDQKQQGYTSNLHTLMIKEDKKLRERASSMDHLTCISVFGHLQTQGIRNKDGKLKLRCYIRPQQLIEHNS